MNFGLQFRIVFKSSAVFMDAPVGYAGGARQVHGTCSLDCLNAPSVTVR